MEEKSERKENFGWILERKIFIWVVWCGRKDEGRKKKRDKKKSEAHKFYPSYIGRKSERKIFSMQWRV